MNERDIKPGVYPVQSVGKALEIVDLLASKGEEMSLTEIARVKEWPKTTVHGLLATLREFSYIRQNPETGRYGLGVRLFELGNQVARNWDVRAAALPIMRKLNQELGEMVQLAVEDQGEVLYLEKLDSTHMIRIVSEIGSRLPMHCSGLGKVLLAYKPPAEVKWILSHYGMKQMTSKTKTNRRELEEELSKIRQEGYAIDDREIMEDLRCVAAPVYSADGCVSYALSISGLCNSMSGKNLERAICAVKAAAAEISSVMGYGTLKTGQ